MTSAIGIPSIDRTVRQLFPTCSNRDCSKPDGRLWTLLGKSRGLRFNSQWYCSLQCLERGAAHCFADLLAKLAPRRAGSHRIPLGLMLLSKGLINGEHLREALAMQRRQGRGRVGELLRQLGAVEEQHITAALGMQWSCPVFPLRKTRRFLDCGDLVPLAVLESSRMVPAHYSQEDRTLYVAFGEGIDYSALYAVEQMLDCKTIPCIADQSALDQALEEISHRPRPQEGVFERIYDHREMARAIRNYAARLAPHTVRAVACGENIWVRLEASKNPATLVFRVPPNSSAAPSGVLNSAMLATVH